MNSFAEKSLPPSDRDETPDCDPALISALKATGLSNAELGRGIGYSAGYVNIYLNNKFNGDLPAIEARIREWLRDRNLTRTTGVTTVDTEASRYLCRKLEEVRLNRALAVITSPAGTGKSRGLGLYLQTHTLAIAFRVTAMHTGLCALADDLCQAADIQPQRRRRKNAQGPAEPRKRRWDLIVEKCANSDRLLIVDDAHELGPRALQCCVDFHEQTGNPVVLLGLPILKKRLLTDARRASRADEAPEIPLKDPRPLIEHLVKELAPDANGDRDALISLCLQVVAHDGAFRAVEKQLQYAARARKKNSDRTWPAAFRAAHKRLLRSYTLN